MSLLKMVRHEPKSPLLEKGSVSLSPVRRRISWTTILTRQRLLAVVSMVLMLEVICTHQYKLSFSRLFQIALYRLTKGVNPLDSAILDVTRSREHTTILRPSIAYELHTLEASGVFGDWFGDPNEVGPSPFDYAIPPEWQRPLLGRRKWTVRTDTREHSRSLRLRPFAKLCKL